MNATMICGNGCGGEIRITAPRGQGRLLRAIERAADAEGAIQVSDMLRLFPNEPEHHIPQPCHISYAAWLAGFTIRNV